MKNVALHSFAPTALAAGVFEYCKKSAYVCEKQLIGLNLNTSHPKWHYIKNSSHFQKHAFLAFLSILQPKNTFSHSFYYFTF
jgi:hypothetical protein